MGAGLPPFFFPIPDEVDNQFTVLTALAYGLRGFNIYMAVERDRWIGAPIDRAGARSPFAEFWQKLIAALEEVRFHELIATSAGAHRHARLRSGVSNRALHAFSPATPALFAVLGSGSHESCFEDDFGLGGAVARRGRRVHRDASSAPAQPHGVPFAHVDG